jgi:hypothetical protein
MLKSLLISSGVALLLVGCATTETKPVANDTSNIPAKVAQSATKIVKPVLKPKAVVNPQTAPVKTAESVSVSSDEALGKQWAGCAGDLEALRLFLTDSAQVMNPDLYHNPQFRASLMSYRQLSLIQDSLYAYAQTASDNSAAVTAHYRQVYSQQYAQYRTDVAPLLQAWKQPHYDPTAYPIWESKYSKQVLKMAGNWTNCADALKKEHSRFDAQVPSNLRYVVVNEILTKQAGATVTHQSQKPGKKRLRKAS